MNDENITKEFDDYLISHKEVLNKLDTLKPFLFSTIEEICKCFSTGGKVLFFGNGGSAGDSQHLCAEFVGRYKKDRKALPAIALTTDTSIITAIANDMGYDKIFERQVRALANKNDILFAISTSGESLNVINAIKAGNEMNIKTIALTGLKENTTAKLCDISLRVPSNSVNHIQELHIMIGHFICEMVEKNY
tara:strand:+ start:11398 stop:11973 length:576 start_codon:yes stop_codon:yes gene_type:complete